MKKAYILSVVVLGLVLAFAAIPIGAFGATPTVVDWSFLGGGTSTLNVVDKDVVVAMTAAGANVKATGQTTDFQNDPYGYNVDSWQALMDFVTTNGGAAILQTTRVNSYVPMYGAAGQVAHWEVYTLDGAATLKAKDADNYAAKVLSQYGYQANDQLTANGSTFWLFYKLDNGNGDWILTHIAGNGSGALTIMNSGADGASVGTEGWTGCYKNNHGAMSGPNTTFTLQALAQHAMSGETWSSSGGPVAYLTSISQMGGSATLNNFWIQGN